MNLSFDTVIVGAGLAGCCSSFVLSELESVLLIDEKNPGSGASGIPVGLFSPLMARRARPVWRMEEANDSFRTMLEEAGISNCFLETGVLKAARSADQATEFMDAAEKWPNHGSWVASGDAAKKWPYLYTQHGVLEVSTGGVVRMPLLCQSLVDASVLRGATFQPQTRIMSWEESGGEVIVSLDSGEEVQARRLILALGAGYSSFPELSALRLHPIKGQWIRLKKPDEIPPGITVSSRSYLASDDSSIVVGGSYEHSFVNVSPSDEVIRELMAEAEILAPKLAGAEPLEAGAGVRVTVPEIRLPMLGPIPGHQKVWMFTGLGAKGLLMAPLLANELPQFFAEPSAIPKEISVNLHR